MSGSLTVEVETFGLHGKFALTLPHPSTAKLLKDAVVVRLKLKPASLQLFGLFLGSLEQPYRVLSDSDLIPTGATVTFQRWNFDVEQEIKIVRRDDNAIHLLSSQSRFHLEKGKFSPTESQRLELESLSDPFFPTERQFLELIQTIPGYSSVQAQDCTMGVDLVSNEAQIPCGTTVTCTADLHSLAIQAGETRIEWAWTQVRRWRTPTPRVVKFDACLKKQNAPVMEWVALETPQAYLLSCAASAMCHSLKEKQEAVHRPLPPPNPRLAGRPFDPLAEFVNKELFGVTQFSSILPKES